MPNIKLFLRESKEEFHKVNWPTPRETVRLTLIVAGISLLVSVLLGVFDIFFVYLLKKFIIG